jgi:hypothetical protein
MKKMLFLLVIILITGLLYSKIRETDEGVEFSIAAPGAGSVSIAGSFNGWDTQANPLQKESDGRWKVVIPLTEGSHTYKLIIDGNWTIDAENPNTVDDGYGGSNSFLEVSGSKTAVPVSAIRKAEPSSVNPKVYFDGRYHTINDMEKGDNSRYSLEKPYHDLNLGIKVKLNPNMEAYTVLNINNTTEGVDMWKTHLNYKRTYLQLHADYLMIKAFDNTGEISFDDPLQIVGGEGYYKYDFGYNYRGLHFFTDNTLIPGANNLPLDFELEAFGSDRRGDDERDISAARLKTGYNFNYANLENRLSLGGSIYSSRINNQYSHSFNEELSYSGGIIDSNPAWEIDALLRSSITQPWWKGSMDFYLSCEHLNFENKKEYKDFDDYEFIVSESHIWQDGSIDHLYLKVDFPEAFSFKIGYQKNEINLYYEEFSDSILVLPSTLINEAFLKKWKLFFNADFDTEAFKANLGLCRFETDYPTSVASWNDYYRFMEKTDGNGKWYQEHSELSFAQYMLLGYDKGLIWNLNFEFNLHKLGVHYTADIAQYDLGCKPELIENTLRLYYDISRNWQIRTDTRLPWYNSDFLGIKTDIAEDTDIFIANYTALRYYLSDNVSLALSYGVNPSRINAITDEFYNGGRREYLDEYGKLDDYLQSTYNGFGEKIRAAEEALAKDNRISLEAVIKF